jgi:hypothetical protein
MVRSDATSGIVTNREIYLWIRFSRDFLGSFGDKYTSLHMKIKVCFWPITLLQNKKIFLRYSNILRPHYLGMTSVLPLSHRNKEHIIECVYL